MSILNIAAYLFVTLDELPVLRERLLKDANALALKGTILLAPEGINLFLAGQMAAIDSFLETLRADPRFAKLREKRSFSPDQPFAKMLVKLKKEIVPLGVYNLDPNQFNTPNVAPTELKAWLDAGDDVILLDTRNQFEFDQGTFIGAESLAISHFRAFPDAIRAKLPEWQNRKIVTFCTGGIRCEKAAPLMESMGFRNVYQLQGGILKYFEDISAGRTQAPHYQGECFVFDERIGVDGNLSQVERHTIDGLPSAAKSCLPYHLFGETCADGQEP